ncbi:histone deacetylase HDT3-like [Asparagus officinalis]|uniref:histone deacetylase HDT3-like n=1 Tax=Asparagus officinalis TaxID=4686 RepID=UPI00098DF141|nr:histone deacetylase HDT3-like [Asparagus officinalis]
MVFTQYWSVKVKPGEPCRVDPGRRRRIMVTQAAFDPEEDDGLVCISVRTDAFEEAVLGTLSRNCTQMMFGFGLCFDKSFELSHTSSKATVHFVGASDAQPQRPVWDIIDAVKPVDKQEQAEIGAGKADVVKEKNGETVIVDEKILRETEDEEMTMDVDGGMQTEKLSTANK